MIARYSRPAMASVWSEESKLARWLDVELAALDAWAEVGAFPREAVRRDPSSAAAADARAGRRDRADATTTWPRSSTRSRSSSAPEGRWFHYGLTSSDVVDTALSLQIQEAGALLLDGLDRALDAVLARAEEHRATLTIGRTHGVHAEPTTFGSSSPAGRSSSTATARASRARSRRCASGKLSGAVGTYAAIDPEVERIACERLGLEPEPVSTQIHPARPARGAARRARARGASLDRFALEIRHLARTEVREVEEPFGAGQKGSSAMPHKRNPIVAERICGLARVVRAAALVGLENVALWHERDISHSSAERVVLPDAFLALDYMLDRFTWLVDGLVVRAERMRRNLDASHGLFFSQRLLLALVETRARARRGVPARPGARDARLGGGARLPRARPRRRRDRRQLDAATSTPSSTSTRTLRHVDTVFERLHALAEKEEPVHA